MSLYIDLTEFFTNPITTGIQRIAGEICKYAPAGTFTPIRLDTDHYVAFSPDLIRTVAEHFERGTHVGTAEIQRLSEVSKGRPVQISKKDKVLVAEVFNNQQRLEFFRAMSQEDLEPYRFMVFDILPLTHPQFFWSDWPGTVRLYEYLKLLRRANCCSFISEDTRDIYYHRMRHTTAMGGVVLPLGCDSLGPRPSRRLLNRELVFSVIGTVEPRKNHRLILEAFEPLLRERKDVTLSFIGRMGWVSSDFAEKVQALAADKTSGFRFFSAPGDDAIRKCIEQSRATIYVSAAEGYGLPPVESLWAGTPVIGSSFIPSLKPLGSTGVHIVDPLTPANLRNAVLAFLEDDYANRKTQEAFSLELPTWKSFTGEVLRWCAMD